jgi:hypothetical protein
LASCDYCDPISLIIGNIGETLLLKSKTNKID